VSLFDPAPLASPEGETRFTLPLAVDEPYLRDHQPGGQPLFSTVMGLEAIVAAARRVRASTAPAVLEDIRVFKPYIVHGDGPHVVELGVTHSLTSDEGLECTLLSRHTDGEETDHLRARVTFPAHARPAVIPTPAGSSGNPIGTRMADGAAVYDLYFHGPSFQVVDGFEFQDDQMVCRLRQRLPPSHRNRSCDSETAPRLIEFGLQCAGLLELAVGGRMMIPHSIARIDRFLSLDVDHPGDIRSIARFQPAERSGVDVDILDGHDRLVLRINQYRTAPLPFAVNQAAAARLRTELLRSERRVISPS
jgi:hypothetical protein